MSALSQLFQRWGPRLGDAAVLILIGLLLWGSYYNHGVYCENFGCIGVGLLWILWSAVWLASLLLCLGLLYWRQRLNRSVTLLRLCAWGLGVIGMLHASWWLLPHLLG